MSEPLTVGEKVERDGACEVMLKLADLATAIGRIPCGEWDYTFTTDPRWRICLNGGPHAWQPVKALIIPRFNTYIEVNGWPAGLLDAAGGTLLGHGLEDDLIAAIDREIAHVRSGGGGRG